MKYIAFVVTMCMALSSCTGTSAAQQLEDIVGVTANENAAVCLDVTIQGTGFYSATSVRFRKMEIPAAVDTNALSAESLQAIKTTICP